MTALPRAILAVAWAVQALRVFHGLDFNDEMQYYGQLVALADTGKLFTSDLFLQQTVYLFLYPLAKLHLSLWGTDHLILAARLLFAGFILWIFGRVRRVLASAGVPPGAASLSALALTFSVPLYNIYAFSYNTVAMGIAAVCFAEMFAWRRNLPSPDVRFWSCAIVSLLLVYPPLGLAVAAVVAARLIAERDYRTIARAATVCATLGSLALWVLFEFTTLNDYADAFAFARTFTTGVSLLESGLEVAVLGLIWCLFIGALVRGKGQIPIWASQPGERAKMFVSIAAAVVSLYALWHATMHSVWRTALLMVLAGFLLTFWVSERAQRQTRAWVSILFLAIGSTMALTSGVGFAQLHAAAMLACAFYFALAMHPGREPAGPALPPLPGARTFGAGLIAVSATLYLANPYRDEFIWKLSRPADDAPAFRHIRISENKALAIAAMRKTLRDIAPGSRVMVVGPHPWIYFATDTRPDTVMTYMHTTGQSAAYEILARRMAQIRPEYLLVGGIATNEITAALAALVESGAYGCEPRALDPPLTSAAASIQTYYDMLPVMTVCRSGSRS